MLPLLNRDLRGFSGANYDKGRNRLWQAAWVATSSMVFERIWCPSKFRVSILRFFGADIGSRVLIRQHVRIHLPWKLTVGSDVWIGVDAWLLNLEPIFIGSNVCLSQGVLLCTGSHKGDSPTFEFDNASIRIEDGAWVAVRATILRGVTVGSGATVGATALVTKSVASQARVFAPVAVAHAIPD